VSALVWVGVGLLGGIGALGRFMLDGAVSERVGSQLPFGTLAVNLSGSLILGILAGAAVTDDALLLSGVALIGSYTTFSTWMFESHRLAEQGRRRALALNLGVSVVLGVGAVALGRLIGGAL
jgi:fluoride exporter